ncbi:MAG: hypothetical protein GAK28_00165 [Luteibacter sp.]|uniref:hypothetical protein n=1 Tax=Luteibacter sp. TaxID=1886636 RepID=UPI00137D1A0F|nr:hypothetical protein [Luteibacter sp.]KAF1009527.1 MAG: hypothetical protein GAK28_00165 [Luteibacter sp.]
MSAEMQKVDVLAVMDRLIELSSSEFNRRRDAGASSGDLHLLAGRTNAAIEARAAVSELIEAAVQAHAYLCEKAPGSATEYRLRAALARVGGAE